MTGDVATGSLFLAYRGHESSISLQLTVKLQLGIKLMSQLCGLHNLVNNLMLGATLGREAQHCHTRLGYACNRLCCACCAHSDLCQLVSIGHRCNGNVAHHDHAVLTILLLVGDEQHGTAHACDAGSTLDNLQCRAQGVARCAEGTADLSVGTFGLDDHASQVERVLNELAGLLNGHALLLAQLSQQGSILLTLRIVQRVDDGSLVEVCEPPLCSQFLYFLRITDEDDVCDVVSQYSVGGLKSALLCCFGEHDALLVALGACNNLL